jgi:hypothetical protein
MVPPLRPRSHLGTTSPRHVTTPQPSAPLHPCHHDVCLRCGCHVTHVTKWHCPQAPTSPSRYQHTALRTDAMPTFCGTPTAHHLDEHLTSTNSPLRMPHQRQLLHPAPPTPAPPAPRPTMPPSMPHCISPMGLPRACSATDTPPGSAVPPTPLARCAAAQASLPPTPLAASPTPRCTTLNAPPCCTMLHMPRTSHRSPHTLPHH